MELLTFFLITNEFFLLQVFVRDGKVFLNQANSNLNECLQVMISLKSAERVFVAIADYDNSEFMNGLYQCKIYKKKVLGIFTDTVEYHEYR